jgi:hypothetical protein
VRADVQYFQIPLCGFCLALTTKWFFVKDQKSSEEQEYKLAPFDPKKELKKLKTSDQLPSEAELVETEPPMT